MKKNKFRIKFKKMKQFRRIGFATVWLCVTALLIAAFMVLFSNSGCSSTEKSNKDSTDKISMDKNSGSVVSGPADELKDNMLAEGIVKQFPDKFNDSGT